MKICINEETTIDSLQEAFSSAYPLLRVVFYAQDVLRNNHGQKKMLTGKIAPYINPEPGYRFIDISKDKTVSEVETAFAELGLHAQILRKSGTAWIETILTRYLTLEVQNHEAEMLGISLNMLPASNDINIKGF